MLYISKCFIKVPFSKRFKIQIFLIILKLLLTSAIRLTEIRETKRGNAWIDLYYQSGKVQNNKQRGQA